MSIGILQTFILILQIVAACCEILGVVFMANSYVRIVMNRQIPYLLLSAIWRGKRAQNAAFFDINEDHRLTSLQGLALIALGFCFQAVAALFSLFLLHWPRIWAILVPPC